MLNDQQDDVEAPNTTTSLLNKNYSTTAAQKLSHTIRRSSINQSIIHHYVLVGLCQTWTQNSTMATLHSISNFQQVKTAVDHSTQSKWPVSWHCPIPRHFTHLPVT